MKTGDLKRIFKIKIDNETQVLEDPNPALPPEEVMELYSTQYPQLINATVVNNGIEDDKVNYEFKTVAGTKA